MHTQYDRISFRDGKVKVHQKKSSLSGSVGAVHIVASCPNGTAAVEVDYINVPSLADLAKGEEVELEITFKRKNA